MPIDPSTIHEGQLVGCRRADGSTVSAIARREPYTVTFVPISLVEDWKHHGLRAPCRDWPLQDLVAIEQAPAGGADPQP